MFIGCSVPDCESLRGRVDVIEVYSMSIIKCDLQVKHTYGDLGDVKSHAM